MQVHRVYYFLIEGLTLFPGSLEWWLVVASADLHMPQGYLLLPVHYQCCVPFQVPHRPPQPLRIALCSIPRNVSLQFWFM